ncbi:uncharacterized protein LOC124364747 isoform X3 [Homalodisca vitripennis]|uniref:uncharacterized protein LOC124364747 isoform X3 n=1 Tax=Homalodisca vitripennis TaxID=197043 RepID=UPI001EEB89BD|nr:uncharacterized protein LOC124364747 isoform X3 [Homalodisca vitripennis]
MGSWQGPPVLVGERALWLGSGSGLPKPGAVRWIGRLAEIGPGWTVGLELDEALPVGGIDGSWGGRELFTCKPKHGLLVPISSIIPGSQFKHLPNIPAFEKSQNAAEHSPVVNLSRDSQHQPQPNTEPLVAEGPRPAIRHKRRIPTPPPSPTPPEPDDSTTEQDQTTLRVEERDQEDSLKKRLRLFTENNGQSRRMNGQYNECSDVVIDSLYAQRRQQFTKHGRSQSDSSHAFISSASSSGSRRERSSTSAIFSIFRWFRKDGKSDEFDAEFAPSAPPSPQLIRNFSSSCGSVDTLFSTATASSFAYVHPALYRPFGAANPPEKRILAGPETETYRNRLKQRDRIRELDKNLTLKKKYHLFGSGTLHRSADDVNVRHLYLNNSLDSLKVNEVSPGSKNSTLGRKKRKAPPPPLIEEKLKENSLPIRLEDNNENESRNIEKHDPSSKINLNKPRHRRTVSDSAKDRKSFVHVKGKRKAPPPPPAVNSVSDKEERTANHEVLGTQSLGRKKRHAPLPPLDISSGERVDNKFTPQGCLTPDEKQRLIDNIAKLQAAADRRSLLLSTPPASPTQSSKMSHTVCNDSLKLEKGVLKANKTEVQSPETKPFTPTPVSPRPWYKRNIINKEKSLEKKKDKSKIDDWMPEIAIARGNVITQDTNPSHVNDSSSNNSNGGNNSYRLSSIFSRFEKPEEKRKSQISMLVNISELDREAAEIVQREQEREKALLAAHDAKFYNSIVPLETNTKPELEIEVVEEKVVEDPPKRSGARELISLFNAIGSVTKVTVNSAFTKEGPSIFTKEGIEKRFSISGDTVKTSEEKVVKETVTKSNGYKMETVIVETKESFSGSPGIKRRRNVFHQDDSGSSSSSEAATPKVVIEEIEDFDEEKSKTQVLYEANKIRKHHSPSPSIPTIAEMSESVSSVATSTGSTINDGARSVSTTPTPIIKPAADVNEIRGPQAQPSKNYSIWTCPRCTLENPRWRVTCEACDMWRPAVRRDVIDKLTNANMGATIAVNVIKGGESNSTSVVKTSTPQTEPKIVSSVISDKEPRVEIKTRALADRTTVNSNGSKLLSSSKTEHLKPLTVSGLLSNDYKTTESSVLEKDKVTSKVNGAIATRLSSLSETSQGVSKLAGNNSSVAIKDENKPTGKSSSSVLITKKTDTPTSSKTETPIDSKTKIPINSKTETPASSNTESDMDEVRRARLAFFQKSQSNENKNEEGAGKMEVSRPSINQAKIDALFTIASKGSLATNEEERLRVKEILKEMKNSLPKKTNQHKSVSGQGNVSNMKEDINVKENINKKDNTSITSTPDSSRDAVRLGAIKKSTVQTPAASASSGTKKESVEKSQNNKKAEIYLVKTETVIEEIKVKGKDGVKTPKMSTSVQTNGVVRKIEPNLSVTNGEGAKSVTGKPPTPKAARKEIIVPVTVEEHVVKDDVVHVKSSKEPRKIGIGTFELIRPRDFASIEATKMGVDVKAPIHVYANIPRTHNDDSSADSTSSSSSESAEISQLTAELTKPKGLADFKAAVLESTAGNKMDTLAVNRLLRQLEAAIAGGQHQRAATLAKQLARHKVNCCVTRHRHTDLITVDMFVEDKLSHQGPFPVQVSPSMTVAQLKARVERQFEIPVTVQRWILGKELAADDTATLQQLGVSRAHCPVFLYLVAPDGAQEKKTEGVDRVTESEAQKAGPTPGGGLEEASGTTVRDPPPGRGWYFNEQNDRYSFCDSEVTDESSKDPSPEPQETAVVTHQQEVEAEEELEVVEEEEVEEIIEAATVAVVTENEPLTTQLTGTLAVGWRCEVCTLMNSPTRPGCLACATARPAGYQVPDGYEAAGAERLRIDQDVQAEQTAAEDKLKNYQQLMVLENADLITTTEPFECCVCLVECAAQDGVVLRDCLHTFCRACLAHTVQFTEEAEVKCPFRDHNYACDSTLQEREIKAVNVSDSDDDDSCIVCMAEPRCCALTPCGHRAYCETCCLRLIELDQMCSLCRRKADGYLIIYL